MDKRKKGHGELVIASSDPAENFKATPHKYQNPHYTIGAK